MRETVHNNMAKAAYEKVVEVGKTNKEFRSLARSFPSIIQVNGLAAAVAFLISKKNSSAHQHMYLLMDQWTKDRFCPNSNLDLMNRIVKMDSGTYQVYVNEIMNICLWVKRFAEGMIHSGLEEN